jgi:ketosteroid isomerase-like protein
LSIQFNLMAMKKHIGILVLAVLGCTTSPTPDQAKKALMETDLAFSSYSIDYGSNNAFAEYIDPEGVLLRPNSYPVCGKEEVVSLLSQRADTLFRLQWKPMFADVSASCDLGYTYGIYQVKSSRDTSLLLGEGLYVTIWKKQPDGSWKFTLDCGTEGLKKEGQVQ